jgi:glycosyl hydrolase family 47
VALTACTAVTILQGSCTPSRTIDPGPLKSSAAQEGDTLMARRVRQAFLHAWQGYRRYAWGHDDLNPVSRTAHDWYGAPLLMSPVDAFDTMLLMGLEAEAAEAKRLILSRLSFDHDISVQVFEVTIRLLGGLLAAYQMDRDPGFLRLATELADRLLPAFESPTGMPFRYVNLRTRATRDPVSNPAEIGTLMLEFGTLTKHTGNPLYYTKAKHAIQAVFGRRSPIGLVGSNIDVRSGEWRDTRSHVGGYIDSYYEYLLKAWLLFRDRDFKDMWDASIGPVNRFLADQRRGELWYGQVDMTTGKRVAAEFGALEAFLPAVLALGGDTARATRLMESVYRMWTTFGVEPETIDYSRMSIVAPEYQLRPESLESAYYLHVLTGNPRYRAMGRSMFEAIERSTRTAAGFASLADVRTGEQLDRMHSFVFAETLKYAYLLFAPPGTLDLGEVVFNTEAHPLKRSW